MTTKAREEYEIQTVRNALRVLEAFFSDDVLGVGELSRRLGLHKNNVFRLLATLELGGYIEQCAERRYRLGSKCLELGRAFGRGRSLPKLARPVLESLAQQLGETAHLGIRAGYDVMHIDAEVSKRLVATTSRVGQRLPMHCSALGKVLLASGSPTFVGEFETEVISRDGLERRSSATIIDGQKFLEHIGTVRLQGYAVDVDECEDGLRCAAAPVFDDAGRVIGALSISGPSSRLAADRLHGEVARALVEAGEQLSRDLGYSA